MTETKNYMPWAIAGVAGASAAIFLWRHFNNRSLDSGLQKKHPAWDAVDQASWESFPASDAPALTSARHRKMK